MSHAECAECAENVSRGVRGVRGVRGGREAGRSAAQRARRGGRGCHACETSLVEAHFAKNAAPCLTPSGRFARFAVRCAPFGPAHPLGGCARRRPPAAIFEKETAFSGECPSPGRFGRARKAAPDSKVSLCWDSKRTRNRNRSPASAGTKGLDFNHSESLILAQNERWQRG